MIVDRYCPQRDTYTAARGLSLASCSAAEACSPSSMLGSETMTRNASAAAFPVRVVVDLDAELNTVR
jgi:hypothetical protein